MKKLAVFVEGQTEQIFVERLLTEIANKHALTISKTAIRGRTRALTTTASPATGGERTYYVLLVDCGGDSSVKSDIRDNYSGLEKGGFSGVIGIRDVYPIPRAKIGELRTQLNYALRTKPFQVVFILGIMEIESWFLSEDQHLPKIDPRLTNEFVEEKLGFRPGHDDMLALAQPATELNNVYQLVGKAYTKKKTHTNRTVDCLDYARLYAELNETIFDLGILVECIDRFLAE